MKPRLALSLSNPGGELNMGQHEQAMLRDAGFKPGDRVVLMREEDAMWYVSSELTRPLVLHGPRRHIVLAKRKRRKARAKAKKLESCRYCARREPHPKGSACSEWFG